MYCMATALHCKNDLTTSGEDSDQKFQSASRRLFCAFAASVLAVDGEVCARMIVLSGVWKSFRGVSALRGVSLSVAAGDALLITGPSGAGKSTLLKLLFAAEPVDRGELTVAGRSLKRLQRSSIPYVRRNIGVV